MIKHLCRIILLSSVLQASYAATIYQWTDPDGTVHNSPVPPVADQLQVKKIFLSDSPPAMAESTQNVPVAQVAVKQDKEADRRLQESMQRLKQSSERKEQKSRADAQKTPRPAYELEELDANAKIARIRAQAYSEVAAIRDKATGRRDAGAEAHAAAEIEMANQATLKAVEARLKAAESKKSR